MNPVQFPGAVFDMEMCLKFQKFPKPKTLYIKSMRDGETVLEKAELLSYGMSFGSRAILGDIAGAHRYGCEIALVQNAAVRERNAGALPQDQRRSYVGFYEVDYGSIKALRAALYSLSFNFSDEGTTGAHFQIVLDEDLSNYRSPQGSTNKERTKAKERERLILTAFLAARINGPARFICDSDADLASDIEALVIPAVGRPILQ